MRTTNDFAFSLTVDGGVKLEPWTDGHAVGFRIERPNGDVEYIYLNPSTEDSEGKPTVFLYQGAGGDPAMDAAQHWYGLDDYSLE
jgi:hypothetical protein